VNPTELLVELLFRTEDAGLRLILRSTPFSQTPSLVDGLPSVAISALRTPASWTV